MSNFRFNSLSFWLGFLAASLFWWVVSKLRPHVEALRQRLKDRTQDVQDKLSLSAEQVQRQNTLEFVQKQHLAASLFSLDEVLITPRLLAPPPTITPGDVIPPQDIVQQTVPYMPDLPAMALEYQSPTLSIGEALQGGANLALIGPPGSGKTVTLAYTASQLARQETGNKDLNQLIPLYVSAANILLQLPTENPVEVLVNALQANPTQRTIRQLPELVQTALDNDLAFLLVDGIDELPPKDTQNISQYLGTVLAEYPNLRLMVTASEQYFDGLLSLGLVPLAVTGWSKRNRVDFAQKWANLWGKYAAPQEDESSVSPLLLNGWLFGERGTPTPLEFTLKVWAVYAGDVLGPSSANALESHLRRMTVNIKENPSLALINIAWQAVNARQITFSEKEAQTWISKQDYTPSEDEEEQNSSPLGSLLSSLIENGFLVSRSNDNYSFGHISIAGYLASQSTGTHSDESIQSLIDQPDWAFKHQTIYYMASEREIGKWIGAYTQNNDFLAKKLLQAGQWLSTLPKTATKERQYILKSLTGALGDSSKPPEVKARIASVLATTGDPQASAIFQYLLKSPQSDTKMAAILGIGFLRDIGAVKTLTALLGNSPEINQAVCLALVNIRTTLALDAVAEALLTGSEQLRRAAAEALANDPKDGHPTLQEGSGIDDILVRHAVIYGLRRIDELWATHILEKMQVEEGEWIVRDAAQQAVDDMKLPPAHIPSPLAALEDTPWLIAFAGEEGVGISAGASSEDMVRKAIEKGSEEQQLAALSLVRRKGIARVFPALYHALYGGSPSVSKAAFDALWHLSAAGAEIPNPTMFGLG